MAKKELQDKDYEDHITTIRECLTALGFDCLGLPDKDVCSLAIELIITPERQAKAKKPRPDTECLSGMQSIINTLSWLDLGSCRRTQLPDTIDTLVEMLEGEDVPTLTEQRKQAKIDRAQAQKQIDRIQKFGTEEENLYFSYQDELFRFRNGLNSLREYTANGDYIYDAE